VAATGAVTVPRGVGIGDSAGRRAAGIGGGRGGLRGVGIGTGAALSPRRAGDRGSARPESALVRRAEQQPWRRAAGAGSSAVAVTAPGGGGNGAVAALRGFGTAPGGARRGAESASGAVAAGRRAAWAGDGCGVGIGIGTGAAAARRPESAPSAVAAAAASARRRLRCAAAAAARGRNQRRCARNSTPHISHQPINTKGHSSNDDDEGALSQRK
jgi:hypothetical protein